MSSLTETAQRRDEAILARVAELPRLADLIVEGDLELVRASLQRECGFLGDRLVPHMRAVEAVIYPELDRVMSCCHSMLGMRREHRELERLIGSLRAYCAALEEDRLGSSEHASLRHALYRLHAILKAHLAEESRLVSVLDRNLPAENTDALARWMDGPSAERP